MSAVAVAVSAVAVIAALTLVSTAGEIVRWVREQHEDYERMAKYRRIRDTNYRLWQEATDPVDRAYYAGVYRVYADKLMELESE